MQPEHAGRYVAHPTVLLTVAVEQIAQPTAFPVCRTKLVASSDQGIQCTLA